MFTSFTPTRKDRRDRQPPPELTTMLRRWGPRQCEGNLRASELAFQFNIYAERNRKDSVREATVGEQVSSSKIHPVRRALPDLDLCWAVLPQTLHSILLNVLRC